MYLRNEGVEVLFPRSIMFRRAMIVMLLLMAAFAMSACKTAYVKYGEWNPEVRSFPEQSNKRLQAFRENAKAGHGYYTIVGRYLKADSPLLPDKFQKSREGSDRMSALCGQGNIGISSTSRAGFIAMMPSDVRLSANDEERARQLAKKVNS
uniref:Uncharacterized protein n=1 Tax=Candidatus Kentrum sp. LPFa TaxID=2126335 RepID=A0A450X0G8_9GAMM|nr:MAG: hypothetical protein BECKLPF1236B_GA0070989_13262 [Candidatus Kentron sp. LPFa]